MCDIMWRAQSVGTVNMLVTWNVSDMDELATILWQRVCPGIGGIGQGNGGKVSFYPEGAEMMMTTPLVAGHEDGPSQTGRYASCTQTFHELELDEVRNTIVRRAT